MDDRQEPLLRPITDRSKAIQFGFAMGCLHALEVVGGQIGLVKPDRQKEIIREMIQTVDGREKMFAEDKTVDALLAVSQIVQDDLRASGMEPDDMWPAEFVAMWREYLEDEDEPTL